MRKFAPIVGAMLSVLLIVGGSNAVINTPTPAGSEVLLAPEFFCERKPDHWRCAVSSPTPPTPTPQPTPTPTVVPTSTPTPSPSPTASPTVAPTPSPTPSPTLNPTPSPNPSTDYILISRASLQALPTSGPAWTALLNRSNQSASSPNVSDQDDPDNITVLAKALVYARTGDTSKRSQVITALTAVQGTESGSRALALGREVGAYVLAADLIDYRDSAFVAWASRMRTFTTGSGPSSLINCHDVRPNNWGTHCGASRVIIDIYVNDMVDLSKAVQVWRGWLGDRAQYAGFSYGDLSWQSDRTKPVGINPRGATISGNDVDGVLPDDQRRGGSFSWPPPCENYVHEALQGVTLAGAILSRAGFPFFEYSDRAVVRAYNWLHKYNCKATGDDTFAPFIVDNFAGTNFAGTVPSNPGKNFGFSDWLWP